MTLLNDITIAAILASASYLLLVLVKGKHARRLPPGPSGIPILGNALELPHASSWLYYAQLKEKYGQIHSWAPWMSLSHTHVQ